MSKVKMPALEESARSTRSRHKEAASVPQLPPLSINAMTMVQLREFVPALMKVVIGDMKVRSLVHRPHWWPPDVPLWSNETGKKEDVLTEAMRKVVRNCYSHLGQEALLSAGKLNEWKTFLASGHTHKRVNGSGDSVSPQYSPEVAKSGKKPFVEIYVCFFCAEEFSSKNEMRQHQANCTQRPEELQGLDTPPQATKRNKKCGKPTLSIPSPPSTAASPTMEHFLKSFNLIPMSKAHKLRASARTSSEVDCSQLDFTDPQTPKSPTTPKTPKLLISQLSRDDSGHCKRRLSYRVREEMSDTESVVSGSSDDTDDQQTPTKNKSLLSIDVSSILGQRLQKHLKSDANISVVANAEAFCKTPVKNQFLEKLRKKENTFPITYKPRKKTKKRPHVHLYCFTKHQRRSNFKRIKTGLNRKSRLLARSLPSCKVVVGRLSHNSMKYWESKSEGDPSKCQSIFPQSPTFLSENIDKLLGLRKKKKNVKLERSLSLANMVSEDMNAEVLQQKVALYRSLLSDLSRSQISISPSKAPPLPLFHDKDKYLQQRFPQLNDLLNSSNNALPVPEPLTPSSTSSSPDSSQQLLKQPFSQPLKIDIPSQYSPPKAGNRQSMSAHSSHGDSLKDLASSPDDSVSIITVSSDEDCFINVLCCTGCRERQKCKCSPLKTSPPSRAPESMKYSVRRQNGQFAKKGELEVQTATVVGRTEKGLYASTKQDDIQEAPLKKKSSTQSLKMKERMSNLRARKLVKVHSSMSKEKAKAKKLSLTREKIKRQLVEMKAKENKASDINKSVERTSVQKKAVENVTVKKLLNTKSEKKNLFSQNKVSKAISKKESKGKSGKDSKAKGEKIYKAKCEKDSKVKTEKKDLKLNAEKKESKVNNEKKGSKVNFEKNESKGKLMKELKVNYEKKNSKVKSDMVSNVKSDKVSNVKSDKVSSVKSDKVSNVKSDKVSNVKSDKVSSVKSDKVSNVKSEKCAKAKSDKDTKSGLKKDLGSEKKKSCKVTPVFHRQSSAPDGSLRTLLHSQGLQKTPLFSVKSVKLGVRSTNSTPTSSPIKRGLKRQASCSPAKSAMPSPKRSKSDLPRKRSNSIAI